MIEHKLSNEETSDRYRLSFSSRHPIPLTVSFHFFSSYDAYVRVFCVTVATPMTIGQKIILPQMTIRSS
jgi:hypothetical protein